MALTDIQLKKVTPTDKDQWLSDGNGLRLLVKPNGSKYWRLKYRFDRKQKTLALGVYPNVSLKEARLAVKEAKQCIAEGVDPSDVKKQRSVADDCYLFERVSDEWWNIQKGTWTPDHAKRIWVRLQANAFPLLGGKPIQSITPQDVIAVVRYIEDRGSYDVAGRVLADINRISRYAIQKGMMTNNPASELCGIRTTVKVEHRPALPANELPQLLSDLDDYPKHGRLLTALALRLLVLTFVRSKEIRGAEWSEIDWKDATWRIPAERMKMNTDHIVPLSSQAIDVLQQVKQITGQYALIFPSERNRTKWMSEGTLCKAMKKMGYDGNHHGKSRAVPHGFRTTACSILNESGFNPDAIERQMSHCERNGVRAAYTHHARYLDERRQMMQWWGDKIEALRQQGKNNNVIAGNFGTG